MDVQIVITSAGIAGALIWAAKFMFDRTLGVIDHNTHGMQRMEIAIERLSILLESEQSARGRLEEEIKMLRNRHHEFANHVQALISRLEMKSARTARSP